MHTAAPPALLYNGGPAETAANADSGTVIERDRPARAELADRRRLDRALATLLPQRKGVVDAYVVSIALDSDPVFGREAREAGVVLGRRFDAAGRTIVLAGADGAGASSLPRGSPESLSVALARVAELMDPKEDVLILYETSHGAPFGIVYHDGDQGFGAISPGRLSRLLDELGFRNRMLIFSACFSGIFLPALANDTSVVVTAASWDRTSFGCRAQNDWTFFGDAFVNLGLRKPQPLDAAFAEASGLIAAWEQMGGLTPSQPQLAEGARTAQWLGPLERRMPKTASDPVGKPALAALEPGAN